MTGRRYGKRVVGRRLPRRVRTSLEPGIGLFANEEGSTTIAAAVAVLVSLALVFGLANAEWVSARAADVQAVADAGALAGMNVVAAYATIAQVLDALVLSMGLIGLLTLAIGLVLSALPLVDAAGPPVVRAASGVFEAREKLARSAASGLESLEEAVPYLVAANSLAVVRANSSGDGNYVGVAVPVPLEGESDFGDLSADDAADSLDWAERADAIEEYANQAQEARRAASDALERGWRADCGDNPSMRERADSLAGLPGILNPSYPTTTGWSFEVPILRARAYYQQRLAQEVPASGDPLERTRSAARSAFYRYALDQVNASSYGEGADGSVTCDLRSLPANTAEVRQTSMYTEDVWPCTYEGDALVIHSYADCPGATGTFWGYASVADEEAGTCRACPVCQFTVADLGRAPAASSSISNGFEYHWKIVVEAARDYEALQEEVARCEEAGRSISDEASRSFQDAIERLGAVRVELVPPGRYGCVCVVADPSVHTSPEALATAVSKGARLPSRVAVSAAVLAQDPAAPGNNTFASFFDGLIERGGAVGGVSSVLDAVVSVWGDLLVRYGDGYTAFTQAVQTSFGQLSDWGLGGLSTWLKQALEDAVSLVGMQPADLSAKKPVLANSVDVMAQTENDWYTAVHILISAIQGVDVGASPSSVLSVLGVLVEALTGDDVITVAQFTVPGTDVEIPIEIDLGWLAGLGEAA